MRHTVLAAVTSILASIACVSIAASLPPLPASDIRTIYNALGLKASGKDVIDTCDEIVQPKIDTIDLNADGKFEVFVFVAGSCYGAAGAELSLFIRDNKGQLQMNLGFPAGGYKLLSTRHMGYPDIEIGGPGFCFPVWRWNGSKYDIYKRCDR
jgi:hypothetical protein